nr:hypothetical protein [Tanacetum cinerariifolium]
ANGARLLWGSSGEGSGDVMEVVEWPGMKESGDVESWRENRVMDINKRTTSKQNRTKPSTKQKAWKSQKSTKVNKKSTPIKSKLPKK